jgi:hypothetical protein
LILEFAFGVVYSFPLNICLSIDHQSPSRYSPIEANPIEAKGKKGGNIPIQANPGNSVATFA